METDIGSRKPEAGYRIQDTGYRIPVHASFLSLAKAKPLVPTIHKTEGQYRFLSLTSHLSIENPLYLAIIGDWNAVILSLSKALSPLLDSLISHFQEGLNPFE